jgi:hypothetical protein
MTTPYIGTKGGNLDLVIRQGATLGPEHIAVRDSSGTPIDITGATLRASIRKTPDAATVAASATFTPISPTAGTSYWEFSATATGAITCSPIDENQPESLYVWDMEIEFASGRILPLLYGEVRVFREVTKP